MNPNLIRETTPTHVTRADLDELRRTGRLIDNEYVLVEQFGKPMLSRVRVVEQKESPR